MKIWNITMTNGWLWIVCYVISKRFIQQNVLIVYAFFSKIRNGRCTESYRYLNSNKPSTIR